MIDRHSYFTISCSRARAIIHPMTRARKQEIVKQELRSIILN
jgi:hypothetical protein